MSNLIGEISLFYVNLTQLEIQIERIQTELKYAHTLEHNIFLLRSKVNSEEEMVQLMQIVPKVQEVISELLQMRKALLNLQENMMIYRIEVSKDMDELMYKSKKLF